MAIETREEWLTLAASLLKESVFKFTDTKELNMAKFSSGFPLGSRGSDGKLGQCLSPDVSSTGKTEIYISPTIADSKKALGVLHHELIHYFIGVEQGHNKKFRLMMRRTGLVGKPTATEPSGGSLKKYEEIITLLGEYPHSEIKIPERGLKGSPMKKVQCSECGYTVRVSEKWINTGLPFCNKGHIMEKIGD